MTSVPSAVHGCISLALLLDSFDTLMYRSYEGIN